MGSQIDRPEGEEGAREREVPGEEGPAFLLPARAVVYLKCLTGTDKLYLLDSVTMNLKPLMIASFLKGKDIPAGETGLPAATPGPATPGPAASGEKDAGIKASHRRGRLLCSPNVQWMLCSVLAALIWGVGSLTLPGIYVEDPDRFFRGDKATLLLKLLSLAGGENDFYVRLYTRVAILTGEAMGWLGLCKACYVLVRRASAQQPAEGADKENSQPRKGFLYQIGTSFYFQLIATLLTLVCLTDKNYRTPFMHGLGLPYIVSMICLTEGLLYSLLLQGICWLYCKALSSKVEDSLQTASQKQTAGQETNLSPATSGA